MVKDTPGSRVYPVLTQSNATKWATRDIAALDFLLNIPLANQTSIVRSGYQRHPAPVEGKWWERLVVATPAAQEDANSSTILLEAPVAVSRSGGRRLDGDNATKVQIPLTSQTKSTRQRTIARQAQIREWELQVAQEAEFLEGRLFFSAKDNYPVSTFSIIKYEPKREEAARRRQKLEERGGGGTQFVVPERDWRGTSYRALLPRKERKHRGFNRFLSSGNQTEEEDDDGSFSDTSSSDNDGEGEAYVPGFLDDPEMRQGRHRHVIIGDRVAGCVVASIIQFVKPADLKADLNKQFKERFDRWEPPKAQLKFIGAKVVDGVYRLIDPEEESDEEEMIRMPPSLTLSKIRSLKQQALMAAVKAQLDISTVALAFVYFERLCLDCRVDKSNRRLAFSACLLLAAKINEASVVALVADPNEKDSDKRGLQSLIRPTKTSSTIFASLLEFFTHDWSLSLKHIFSAEWGVFAALGFRLHATPSQVEFHFRRLLKTLGWNALAYLGPEMYTQWQDCLEDEERRQNERVKRRDRRRENKERKLLKLELQRQKEEKEWQESDDENEEDRRDQSLKDESPAKRKQPTTAMKLLNRFTILGRPASSVVSSGPAAASSEHQPPLSDRLALSTHDPSRQRRGIIKSPSMPSIFPGSQALSQSAPNSPMLSPQHHVALEVKSLNDDMSHKSSSSQEQAVAYEDDSGIIV
jgi:hypothetical protein